MLGENVVSLLGHGLSIPPPTPQVAVPKQFMSSCIEGLSRTASAWGKNSLFCGFSMAAPSPRLMLEPVNAVALTEADSGPCAPRCGHTRGWLLGYAALRLISAVGLSVAACACRCVIRTGETSLAAPPARGVPP